MISVKITFLSLFLFCFIMVKVGFNESPHMDVSNIDPKEEKFFHARLLKWFRKNQRDLPWRKNRTPYKTWISEIMLQQTQVDSVISYFKKWNRKYPNVACLAKAPDSELLKLWEGLGYYARAKNLKKTAQILINKHNGVLPQDYKELIQLPGIGPYSAGAILSLGYDLAYPVVDGNVARVLCRLFGYQEDIGEKKTRKQLWSLAENLLNQTEPAGHNEALMELGALVCKPVGFECAVCPIRKICVAYETGLQLALPVKKRKIRARSVLEARAVLENQGKFFIYPIPEGEVFGGLWDFPKYRSENLKTLRKVLRTGLKKDFGFEIKYLKKIGELQYAYTRFRVTSHVFRGHLKKNKRTSKGRWVKLEELKKYAMTGGARKTFRWIK